MPEDGAIYQGVPGFYHNDVIVESLVISHELHYLWDVF